MGLPSSGLKYPLLVTGLVLLTGCHDLENKAKDVIGATVKDPLALELRNVRASDTVPTTICGEFNSKNSFGGYVGFKPFAIDTRHHDELTELDDDAGGNDRDQYYLVCGDEGQRLEARLDTQAHKDAANRAERAAAAAEKAILRSLNEANEVFISSTFKPPHLPSPIENVDCNMGGCYYEQIISINDIERHGREVLRAVHSRINSDTQSTWKRSSSYVLCSLDRPTSFSWDSSTRSYMETPLHVLSPGHAEYSAVVEYLMACHDAKPGSREAEHPAELGYVDRTGNLSQTHIVDPKQIFASAN